MSEKKVIYADPFFNKCPKFQSVPEGAVYLCTYEVNYGIAEYYESAYFRRMGGNDELWLEMGDCFDDHISHSGCAFVIPSGGSNNVGSKKLLGYLIISRVGHCWPGHFIAPGLLDEASLKSLVRQIKKDLDEKTEQAMKDKPEITFVAEKLGLNPRPTGTSVNHWNATCPGTNHSLQLQGSNNLFFCGYCNRSGGIDDLKTFAEERKKE